MSGILFFIFASCHPLIHHFQVVNFLKNWFWTLIFVVKIEGNLIFLWNEFLVHGLKIIILRILILLITLLLVCFMLIIPKFTYSLLNETCLSNRDTEYLIAEKTHLYCYILFLFCYYFGIIFLHPICWQILNLKWLLTVVLIVRIIEWLLL